VDRQRRRRLFGFAGTVPLVGALFFPVAGAAVVVAVYPTVAEYTQLTTSATPPTQAQCASAGRRCFGPQAIRAAYNGGPLYAAGYDGSGQTIAIIDS
jgi:subtilase family serine protease